MDLLSGIVTEESSLDDQGDRGEVALAQDLEVSELGDIDHRGLSRALLGLLVDLSGDQGPELLHVDGGAVAQVLLLVESSHANLTEVTRVVLIHQDSVVVLATGVTAATRMLSVLADTTVTTGDVTSLLSVLV